jgi:hypothetical protein
LTDSTSASRWQVVGGTGSGGGATEQVTQTGIGNLANFPVGTPLYVDASTGWTAANASAANTAEVAGMIGRSLSANLAEVVMAGEVSGVTASVFTEAVLPAKGEVVFLSTTSGKLTITEPSVVGQVSKPLGVVHNVNGATSVDIMFFNWRGSVVGGANARTTISLANSAATSVQNVSAYDAGELAGWVFIDGTANTRFYIQAQFAKNGAGTDYNLSYQTTGDTPVAGFSMTVTSAGVIQVTLPSVAGFTSATINYALNAPAVGASLPLSVDSTALNIVDSAPLSYRNRIINGDMRIDQRNAGASVTITNTAAITYAVDRWAGYGSVASKFSLQQNAGAITPPASFKNYLGATSLAATSLASGDYYVVQQRIEGFNTADLSWGDSSAQAVTLSFWVRSSLSGTFGGSLTNNNDNYSYPFNYTITAANTWERKTITVPGPTAGTWATDNTSGIKLYFSLGTGTTLSSSSANSWQPGVFTSTTGATSVVGTNGATFYLTGVQLEVGSKASAFERRPYSLELSLAQRYYETIGLRFFGGIYVSATTRFVGTQPVFFKVTKRTSSPQFSIVGGTAYWADSNLIYSATSNTGFNFSGDEFSLFYWQTRQAGGTTPADGKFVFLESYPTVAVSNEL